MTWLAAIAVFVAVAVFLAKRGVDIGGVLIGSLIFGSFALIILRAVF